MKKIVLTLVIAVMMCGCVSNENSLKKIEIAETASTAIDKNTIDEIPTTAPSDTPTPEHTEMITPSQAKNDEYDLIIDFNQDKVSLTGDYIGQNEIKSLSKFSFTDSEIIKSYNQITVAEDNDGHIYFVDRKGISVIDTSTDEIKTFRETENITEEYKSDKFTEYSRYIGVMYIENILYLIVQTEPDYYEYNYYVVNSKTGEISDNYLNKPIGYCGNMILDLKGRNSEKERFDYRFYDVIEDEFYDINLDSIPNNSRIISEVAFATEGYILLINTDNSYEQEETIVKNKNLFFINAKTFELEAIYTLTKNGISSLHIFDYDDGMLYFFEDEINYIKTLNPNTWELNRICYFDKQTMYAGYDRVSRTLSLKQRYNYKHTCDTINRYNCISSNADEQFDVFFEYDISENKYEVTDKVFLSDELNEDSECLSEMKDFKIGGYIFNIFESSYEGGLEKVSLNFIYKIRAGTFIGDH